MSRFSDITLTANARWTLPKPDIAFVLKWAASMIQIVGYIATAFGMTPLNIYIFLVGLTGWFVVGLMWNDRALMLIHIVAVAVMLAGLANS